MAGGGGCHMAAEGASCLGGTATANQRFLTSPCIVGRVRPRAFAGQSCLPFDYLTKPELHLTQEICFQGVVYGLLEPCNEKKWGSGKTL
jgi:hypothetical protein